MKWTYSESDFLDEFVKYIGKNCRFSATLIPNISEFIDAIERGVYPQNPPEKIKEKIVLKGQRLDDDLIKWISLFSLCEKHNIYPFWGLSFDNSFHQFNDPKIYYVGPKNEDFGTFDVTAKPQRIFMEPSHFTKNKKWYFIEFIDFMNESLEGAKRAIKEFVEDGYKLISLSTKLNPQMINEEEEEDLYISASKGKIEIYGKVPDNFKMPTTKKGLETFFKC